jgi:hypothetical protein
MTQVLQQQRPCSITGRRTSGRNSEEASLYLGVGALAASITLVVVMAVVSAFGGEAAGSPPATESTRLMVRPTPEMPVVLALTPADIEALRGGEVADHLRRRQIQHVAASSR